jgi:hypothetical protein
MLLPQQIGQTGEQTQRTRRNTRWANDVFWAHTTRKRAVNNCDLFWRICNTVTLPIQQHK